MQVGLIGANDSLDRFDPERGLRLATFCIRRVIGAMQDHQRQMGYLLKGGERRDYHGGVRREERIQSIDALCRPRGDRDESERMRKWEPAAADVVTIDETEAEFEALLSRLGLGRHELRLRGLLKARFIDGKTLWQIGDLLGLSESRVSQMLSEALRRLKAELDPGPAMPRINKVDRSVPEAPAGLESVPTVCPALTDVLERGGNPTPALAELGRRQIEEAKAAINRLPRRANEQPTGIEKRGGVRPATEPRGTRTASPTST